MVNKPVPLLNDMVPSTLLPSLIVTVPEGLVPVTVTSSTSGDPAPGGLGVAVMTTLLVVGMLSISNNRVWNGAALCVVFPAWPARNIQSPGATPVTNAPLVTVQVEVV